MQVDRNSMTVWVESALRELGGSGTIIDVCKAVWAHHGDEIQASGDMFFKWQYEIRWAADSLRRSNVICPADQSPKGIWELAPQLAD